MTGGWGGCRFLSGRVLSRDLTRDQPDGVTGRVPFTRPRCLLWFSPILAHSRRPGYPWNRTVGGFPARLTSSRSALWANQRF